MKTFDFPQRSPEWYQIRAKVPTASCFDQIITTKGEPSKQAVKYMYKLAGESISGITEDSYKSAYMERGIEIEEEAKAFYEMVTGNIVTQVGFCISDDGLAGCSPDGLVEEDGLIEVKCPAVHTHVGYLLDGKLPTEYFQQVHGSLYVTGRKWCDFISYYPSLKPLIIRVEPDIEFQKCLDAELKMFNTKLQTIIKKIGE